MSESFIEKADDFMRAAANAATFGAADYIAAYGNRAIFGGTREENLAEQVKYSAIAEERSPVTTSSGRLIGSMLAAEALSLGLTGESIALNASASLQKILGLTGLSGALYFTLDGRGHDSLVKAEPATEPTQESAPESSTEVISNSAPVDFQIDSPNPLSLTKPTIFSKKLAPQNEMWQQYLPPLKLDY